MKSIEQLKKEMEEHISKALKCEKDSPELMFYIISFWACSDAITKTKIAEILHRKKD